MARILSIDGNIASGKTSVLAAIARLVPDVPIVTERIDLWEAHGAFRGFLADPARYAFPFQMDVTVTRWAAVESARRIAGPEGVVVLERGPDSERFVFAARQREEGHIGDVEWNVYAAQWDALQQHPTWTVFLSTPVDVCLARIAERGRPGEETYTRDDLQDLDNAYARMHAVIPPDLVLDTTAATPDRLAQRVVDLYVARRSTGP